MMVVIDRKRGIFSRYVDKGSFARVHIFLKNRVLLFKGPLGLLKLKVFSGVFLRSVSGGLLVFGSLKLKPLILTFMKKLFQLAESLDKGFSIVMLVKGVGWRVSFESEKILVFFLGYSHSVQYSLKGGVEVAVLDKQRFRIFGSDSTQVRQTVAELGRLRKFNIYKGKGVFCRDQVFRLKVGSKS
jgi:ribosomal protein L6P/L9E